MKRKDISLHLPELALRVVASNSEQFVPTHSQDMYIDHFICNVPTYMHTLVVPKYHRCFVESISSVTHDSKLFSLRLPAGSYLNVPTGHHLAIRADVDGKLCTVCIIMYVAAVQQVLYRSRMGLGGLGHFLQWMKANTHTGLPNLTTQSHAPYHTI